MPAEQILPEHHPELRQGSPRQPLAPSRWKPSLRSLTPRGYRFPSPVEAGAHGRAFLPILTARDTLHREDFAHGEAGGRGLAGHSHSSLAGM